MIFQGNDDDQLNALQLLMNWPQLIALMVVVPAITLRLPESTHVAPAYPQIPFAAVTVPLLVTVITLGLQALLVYLGPMNRQATVRRKDWEDTKPHSDDLNNRWAGGSMAFAVSAGAAYVLLQFGQIIFNTILTTVLAAVAFCTQSYLVAAVGVPLVLFGLVAAGPTLVKKATAKPSSQSGESDSSVMK